jgi:hypothetical protein
LFQQPSFSCINGNVAASLNQGLGIALNVTLFAKQGRRLVAGIEGYMDDLGALCDENPLFRLYTVAKLGFCQGTEYLDTWR